MKNISGQSYIRNVRKHAQTFIDSSKKKKKNRCQNSRSIVQVFDFYQIERRNYVKNNRTQYVLAYAKRATDASIEITIFQTRLLIDIGDKRWNKFHRRPSINQTSLNGAEIIRDLFHSFPFEQKQFPPH